MLLCLTADCSLHRLTSKDRISTNHEMEKYDIKKICHVLRIQESFPISGFRISSELGVWRRMCRIGMRNTKVFFWRSAASHKLSILRQILFIRHIYHKPNI